MFLTNSRSGGDLMWLRNFGTVKPVCLQFCFVTLLYTLPYISTHTHTYTHTQYYRESRKRNILHKRKRRKANWISHILHRNCQLEHVIEGQIEGRIEVAGRRGRRCKRLLDDLKETRGYWKLKEEELDRTLWRNRFGRDYGPVVRQTTE